MITTLAGGVGAARFLQGLIKIVPEKEVTVIVNTGDDIQLYGLHVSPDLDIIMYTLAGIVDEKKDGEFERTRFTVLNCFRDMDTKRGLNWAIEI